MDMDDVFTIKARKCKRCGGLLTSAQALRDGYGSCCLRKMKQDEQAKEEAKNQYSLFTDIEPDPEPKRGNSLFNMGECKTGWSPYGSCVASHCAAPYECCTACPESCNSRCGWIPEQ